MKQLTILMCAFFAFTACKKTLEDLPRDVTTTATQNDAVTVNRIFTFDSSRQNWSISGDAKLLFSATKGNPKGSIYGKDLGAATFWYFKAAPLLLKGIKAGNYLLKFELKAPSSNKTNEPDIRVISPTIELVADMPKDPNDVTWTTYEIPLNNSGGWRIGALDGKLATNNQIFKAFGTITDLLIRGDFTTVANKGFLDNVSYATIPTTPPIN